MTTESDQPEDIAGLFRKFGGDPMAYKEFAPRDEPGGGAGAWALISPNASTVRSTAPSPSPLPVSVPAAPPPRQQAETFAPAAAAPKEPRELDALFARLLGTPQPAVPTGHGLLSRWRSPS